MLRRLDAWMLGRLDLVDAGLQPAAVVFYFFQRKCFRIGGYNRSFRLKFLLLSPQFQEI